MFRGCHDLDSVLRFGFSFLWDSRLCGAVVGAMDSSFSSTRKARGGARYRAINSTTQATATRPEPEAEAALLKTTTSRTLWGGSETHRARGAHRHRPVSSFHR